MAIIVIQSCQWLPSTLLSKLHVSVNMWYLLYKIHNIDTIFVTYPLFLTGNKGLEARCNSEAQLVYEGWLILRMDLNFDPRFK